MADGADEVVLLFQEGGRMDCSLFWTCVGTDICACIGVDAVAVVLEEDTVDVDLLYGFTFVDRPFVV